MKIDENSVTFSVDRVTITLVKKLLDRKYFQDIRNAILEKRDTSFLFKENSLPVLFIQVKRDSIFLTGGRMTCQIIDVSKFVRIIEDIINLNFL